MKATCPKCGFSADAPESLSGKTLQCPKCQEKFACGEVSAFTVVEDTPAKAASPKPVVEEKELASLTLKNGALVLTNKHLRGRVTTFLPNVGTKVEDIDVLLNGIVSTSITSSVNPSLASAFGFCFFVGLFCALIGISYGASEGEPAGIFLGILGLIIFGGVAVYLFRNRFEHAFALNIMGTSMSIRIPKPEQPLCEKFIEKLKAAKKRYEEGL